MNQLPADSSSLTMDCDAFRTVLPAEFHRRFLVKQVRSDGRYFLTYRQPRISSNALTNCCGSASVRAGNNYYLAGVRGEVGPQVAKVCASSIRQPTNSACSESSESLHQPQDETSNSSPAGRIIVSVEFPSICGAEFSDGAGPNTNAHLLISGVLTDLLNSNSVIDTSQLLLRATEGEENSELDEDELRGDEDGAHSTARSVNGVSSGLFAEKRRMKGLPTTEL
uniref:Putative 3' exoribonuclease family domain 1 protein n=1 Tax=Toxoplasma gondii COUG TaxID=1074873 RepID=A0A2G8XYR8_TOXGO|nr:putative 3' exoribonuclease family domain 1 protein [Toxoplasma gondii COUG]